MRRWIFMSGNIFIVFDAITAAVTGVAPAQPFIYNTKTVRDNDYILLSNRVFFYRC